MRMIKPLTGRLVVECPVDALLFLFTSGAVFSWVRFPVEKGVIIPMGAKVTVHSATPSPLQQAGQQKRPSAGRPYSRPSE